MRPCAANLCTAFIQCRSVLVKYRLGQREMPMLESIIDLLNGLFFIATISLTAVCVVGSIVVALRAVGRETATSESIHRNLVDDTQPVERPVRTHVQSADSVLGSVGPEKALTGKT
jgi:hypothetical protein